MSPSGQRVQYLSVLRPGHRASQPCHSGARLRRRLTRDARRHPACRARTTTQPRPEARLARIWVGASSQSARSIPPAGSTPSRPAKNAPRGGHLHLVVGPAVESIAVGKDNRETVEPRWQPLQGDVDRRGVKSWRDEQLHAGAEIVVRGNLAIEAEDLGTLTEQRGSMRHARDQRPDRPLVESSRKITAGHGSAITVQSRQNSLPSGSAITMCPACGGVGSWRCSRVAPWPTSRSASCSSAAIRASPSSPDAARTSR